MKNQFVALIDLLLVLSMQQRNAAVHLISIFL